MLIKAAQLINHYSTMHNKNGQTLGTKFALGGSGSFQFALPLSFRRFDMNLFHSKVSSRSFVSRFTPAAVAAFAAPVFLTSCYAEIHEHPTDSSPVIYSNSGSGMSSNSNKKSTDNVKEPPVNTICRSQDCRKIPVYVIYTLNQDLGVSNTVVIEAFENSNFEGSPQATATLSGFDASGTGKISEGQLALAAGKYYLRAFITNKNAAAAPYEYGGMKLVSNKPVGYFGAASGAQSLIVESGKGDSAPVTIKLNYLFKSDEKETPSDANLRVQFSIPQSSVVEPNRKLRIELRDSTDMACTPKANYFLPSDTLLVSGRMGRAEFVARNLQPGKYTVLAYMDLNDNEYPDSGELQQTWNSNGSPALVTILQNRTETIKLELQ